tara:strand:- start:13275 stop:19211 length:5937 start_codon:yes stop_codon:yes gene_type:complete
MAKKKIYNYKFYPGIGLNDNTYPNAWALLTLNKTFIQKEVTAWIAQQVADNASGFEGYTYNGPKCERDTGYNIDAWAHDLRYTGNEETTRISKTYWEQDVAQVDGDRQAEIKAKEFTRDLIINHVFTNSPQTQPYQGNVAQVTNGVNAENAAGSIIQTLSGIVINVLTTGTSALPTFQRKGLGHVRFQGNYDASDLLIVTNTTKTEVIYNFTDALKGGKVTRIDDVTPRDSGGYIPKYDSISSNENADDDFPKYLQTTDAVTILDLTHNTSTHSETDELQIFIDSPEQRTRPFDFGTDAIERMRIAPPLSMLDADFEYGLQPTKWSAIGMMRGYPSVYELPGTETQVLSVVTDASVGTSGIGASKITVTTIGAHGFEAGTPITIKALEDAVVGAARAEGSFIIDSIPTTTSFTYFAKAKVGTNNGDVLSTTYTQLRQGAFYTGASVGQPLFSVFSNGTNGTMTLSLAAQQNENRLAFTGDVPEIGAPIVNAAFPTGTQVTAIAGTPGGTALPLNLTADIAPGNTDIQVSSTTGIVIGQAADNGSGDAIFVNNIAGTTVSMSGSFTTTITRNTESYTGVTGTITAPAGTNAEFTISRTGVNYAVDTVSQAGSGYKAGDRILVTGDNLGGQTPANDATVLVTTVNGTGGVTAASISGTALSGTITYTGPSATLTQNGGTIGSTQFDINYEGTGFTTVDINSPNDTTGYAVGDRLRITGSTLLGGVGQDGNVASGGNDFVGRVTAVGGGGSITTLVPDNTGWSIGTAPSQTRSYSFGGSNLAFTGGTGSGFEFSIDVVGTTYNFMSAGTPGTGYTTADTIVCAGTNMGGASPTNDLYLRVVAVDGAGGIIDVRVEGSDESSVPVAFNGGTYASKNLTDLVGQSATFNITNDGTSFGVVVTANGTDYHTGQTFVVAGNLVGGSTPANDCTVTIDSVNGATGAIATASASGSAPALPTVFSGQTGTNQAHAGASGTFDITRTSGTYSVSVNASGSGYEIGNVITVPGNTLGGATPANDAEVVVTNIDGSGGLNSVTITGAGLAGGGLNLVSGVTLTDFTTQSISASSSVNFEALSTIEITWPYAHGIVPGDTFVVDVNSDDGGTNNHTLAAGSFIAIDVPTSKKIRYNTRAPGSVSEFDGTSTEDRIQGNVYLRPDSFFIHRPYDGGVQLGTGGPQHGAQAIRQSKKYIRYQSGKGIMYTTGALFAPSYDLRSVTADGTGIGAIVTIATDDNDHGAQVGGRIRLIGVETAGYNGEYVITQIIDERTLKCLSTRRLGSQNAILGFSAQMTVVGWHGATVRSGIFDDQNGIYWEYDGTNIAVAQRTSTKQIAGTAAVSPDSNLVTGNNTRFRDQLKAGDRIVIKGMTHVVANVDSQTQITVTPDFRGVNTIASCKVNLITDKKVLQEEWNLDRMDGTGQSGYNMDVRYMQMIGIQYSWYGAGFIDWMARGADGNFVFCHRMRNSNVNTEAFMRSGNLPVRYEVTNEGAMGMLSAEIDANQTFIPLTESKFFPDSGTVYIDNEIISYTTIDHTAKRLTNCTRGTTLQNFQAGATRQYTASPASGHAIRSGVILISNTITPLISHWGSAFITDGMFDEDRGYIFSYTETGLNVSTTRQTAFLLRLAPSVSNAIVGDLGDRELLNRAQLLMQGLEITSDGVDPNNNNDPITGGIVVEGILNPQNYPLNPSDIGWSGLAGLAQGGQPSFAQVASGGSVNWNSGDTATYSTAAVMAQATTTATLMPWWSFRTNRNYGYFTQDSWETANLSVGDEINTSGANYFPQGTTVQTVVDQTIYGRYLVYFSQRPNSNSGNGASQAFQKGGDLNNSSFAFFTKTVWDAAGARNGTEVGDANGNATNQSDVTMPAGSYVSSVDGPLLFGDQGGSGIEYYRVNFNSTFNGTLQPTDLFNFKFQQPPYAQPGETVFSFIAQPGERSTLDLGLLKELTNTTLGGRGTFPNGPDVLALNVYKTSGVAVDANIIIKWGEAQA